MLHLVCKVPTSYLPCLSNIISNNVFSLNELILRYFNCDFWNGEIMLLLLYLHQVNISLSTLKRRLRSLRLKRKLTESRNTISSYNDVINAIITEIGCSGRCIGYRSMWYRLRIEWGIRFPRDEILRLMRIVDPERIRVRKRRRLHRRRYICKGPNAVWHVDGYDKIKPFGFCIHGCVDGFGRRIIWLRVGKTNTNPEVIDIDITSRGPTA
ncbi:hypothetical protein SNE40_016306 [Patella caerulea]|uniref:Integrase core domain-containing protein n=2 Tax=Patella caerulea TaxID=87958 RepID=A0AAN8J8J6_PATCE